MHKFTSPAWQGSLSLSERLHDATIRLTQMLSCQARSVLTRSLDASGPHDMHEAADQKVMSACSASCSKLLSRKLSAGLCPC